MRARRITGWGWAAIGLMVASVVFAILNSRERSALRSVGWFIAAAVTGWIVVALVFRWRERRIRATSLALIGAVVLVASAVALPPPAFSGVTFGALLAWFPHCWDVVGVA
jgi:hypothetical protein